jgi:two-component system, cell cycle response regulator
MRRTSPNSLALPDIVRKTARGAVISRLCRGVRDNDGETKLLRHALAALTDEARRNEEAWKRAQRREMALLEAATLGDLLGRLTDDLRVSFGLPAVTVVLADPEHEMRHLLLGQGAQLRDYARVLFVDSARTLLGKLKSDPWLGQFDAARHEVLFPLYARIRSVALVPLRREGRLFGSINLGSDDAERFTREHATDFLRHLGFIAAFCLENAMNRARLTRNVFTDVLTGWHNRRYLESRLREELARCRREHSTLTCLMIDVDHFKRINDEHGHAAGDEVLKSVARRVSRAVRGSDVAARYGGEEFVILLPGTEHAAAALLAERIRRAVADEPFEIGGKAPLLGVTVSIGVAEYRGHDGDDVERSCEKLLERADVALYEAKTGGRNAVAHAATG